MFCTLYHVLAVPCYVPYPRYDAQNVDSSTCGYLIRFKAYYKMPSKQYKIVKHAKVAPHLLRGGESPAFDFAYNAEDLKTNEHCGTFGRVMGGVLSRNLSSQQSRTLLRNYGWAKYGAAIKTTSTLRMGGSTSMSNNTTEHSMIASSYGDFRSQIKEQGTEVEGKKQAVSWSVLQQEIGNCLLYTSPSPRD